MLRCRMRIVHVSDTHGTFMPLPKADLYVHSGDIYPTIGTLVSVEWSTRRQWRLVPSCEKVAQEEWAADDNQWHKYLGSPNAPIVCVRGNHDFADAAHVFRGCNVVELFDNELHTIAGLRITGHRGVPTINGVWSDEVHRADLLDRAKRMPDADIYVTHYPPAGVLSDDGIPGSKRGNDWGLDGLANYLVNREPVHQAWHLFGHIHEHGGERLDAGTILFSNAATTFNVIDIL